MDEIGIEYEDPNANTLDTIIERFGMSFPKTVEFSDLARLTLPEVSAVDDPDVALLAWLNHEEALFRRLEKRIVSERIQKGFFSDGVVDVDSFIQYSLGVQNRRKSRRGYSFENQLEAVFNAFDLRYSSQVKTEKGKRPDFIFPGEKEYSDKNFNIDKLVMLAAKTTCKERWSQILPEAERITLKHLVTLEPSISIPQTTSMRQASVQLILPLQLHASYTTEQQRWLWSVANFVDMVKCTQKID